MNSSQEEREAIDLKSIEVKLKKAFFNRRAYLNEKRNMAIEALSSNMQIGTNTEHDKNQRKKSNPSNLVKIIKKSNLIIRKVAKKKLGNFCGKYFQLIILFNSKYSPIRLNAKQKCLPQKKERLE